MVENSLQKKIMKYINTSLYFKSILGLQIMKHWLTHIFLIFINFKKNLRYFMITKNIINLFSKSWDLAWNLT